MILMILIILSNEMNKNAHEHVYFKLYFYIICFRGYLHKEIETSVLFLFTNFYMFI